MIAIIAVVLQSIALIIWAIWSIMMAKKVSELEKKQEEQRGINVMVVKHLNQLLTDVEALIEDHDNV